ncbi:DUF6415 family natural product biosynthesis protein [Streptomyces sp. NPDC059466]|uniref:DUF6415 family natural product biosynthesis protein n=1 Tax=Streptomyces sp. NPDC059466 TaxID=3346843 RepID=UPI0036C0139F
MTAVRATVSRSPIDTAMLRAYTPEILGPEPVLPRYERLQFLAFLYRGVLLQLIPVVEKFAIDLGDDFGARCALAGIGEARRRLDEIEAPGLAGEVSRTQRLGRSVLALCDHYDNLTGVRMCVQCDRPIGPDGEPVPYDSDSAGGQEKSMVHAACLPPRPRD